MSVAFLHCTTCALARCCLSCPITVCIHVHELRRCSDFDQALCTRSAFQVSHNTLPIHLVTLGWTRNFSFCFFHAVHDVCSLLAHVQQFSHNCSRHCSSFNFLFTLGVITVLLLSQTKNIYHVSDVLRICFHRVSTCRSLNHSAQEINVVTCLPHSSCDPHENLG